MATDTLHRKVIRIIEIWLNGGMPGYEMLCKDGRWRTYKDLMDGVDIIRVPDDENDLLPVGGIRNADITLLDKRVNPVRIIEVEVTSPIPQPNKKLLESRGVEVIEVKVRSEADLREHTFRLRDDSFRVQFRTPGDERVLNIPETKERLRRVYEANTHIEGIIDSLQFCDPETRRKLKMMLDSLDSLDSYYPTKG